VTGRIFLEPFDLGECEAFFEDRGIELSRYSIVESYMIFGGIPYYLSLFIPGYSLAQNFDALLCGESAPLSNEFNNLYNSIFKNADKHISVVNILGEYPKGLTRNELIDKLKILDGGGFSKILEDLELSGFIKKGLKYPDKLNGSKYTLVDYFTLFYIKYVRNNYNNNLLYFQNLIQNISYFSWKGLTFERVCFSHINQIKNALGISGVNTVVSYFQNDRAQIDLVIDRSDNIMNMCEVKYSDDYYLLDKEEELKIRNRLSELRNNIKKKQSLVITMITTYGLKQNIYSNLIQKVIILDDLFIDIK
jgi:hypothetical protein